MGFMDTVKGWFSKAKDTAGDVADKAGDMAEGAWDKTKDVAGDVADKAGDVAEKAGDVASADLATQRINIHEKTAWMLRSTVE